MSQAEMADNPPPQNIGSEEGTEEIANSGKAPLWVHAIYFLICTGLMVFCIIWISKIIKMNKKIKKQRISLQTDLSKQFQDSSKIAAEKKVEYYQQFTDGKVGTNGSMFAYNVLDHKADWFTEGAHATMKQQSVYNYKKFADAFTHEECFGKDTIFSIYGLKDNEGGLAGDYAREPTRLIEGENGLVTHVQAIMGIEREKIKHLYEKPPAPVEGQEDPGYKLKDDKKWKKCTDRVRKAQVDIQNQVANSLNGAQIRLGVQLLRDQKDIYNRVKQEEVKDQEERTDPPYPAWELEIAAISRAHRYTSLGAIVNYEDDDMTKRRDTVTDLFMTVAQMTFDSKRTYEDEMYRISKEHMDGQAACSAESGAEKVTCLENVKVKYDTDKYKLVQRQNADYLAKWQAAIGDKPLQYFVLVDAEGNAEERYDVTVVNSTYEDEGGWELEDIPDLPIDNSATLAPIGDEGSGTPAMRATRVTQRVLETSTRKPFTLEKWESDNGYIDGDGADKGKPTSEWLEKLADYLVYETINIVIDQVNKAGLDAYIPNSVPTPAAVDMAGRVEAIRDSMDYNGNPSMHDEQVRTVDELRRKKALDELKLDPTGNNEAIKKAEKDNELNTKNFNLEPEQKIMHTTLIQHIYHRMEVVATSMFERIRYKYEKTQALQDKKEKEVQICERENVPEGEAASNAHKQKCDKLKEEETELEDQKNMLDAQRKDCIRIREEYSIEGKERGGLKTKDDVFHKERAKAATLEGSERFVRRLGKLERRFLTIYSDIRLNTDPTMKIADKKITDLFEWGAEQLGGIYNRMDLESNVQGTADSADEIYESTDVDPDLVHNPRRRNAGLPDDPHDGFPHDRNGLKACEDKKYYHRLGDGQQVGEHYFANPNIWCYSMDEVLAGDALMRHEDHGNYANGKWPRNPPAVRLPENQNQPLPPLIPATAFEWAMNVIDRTWPGVSVTYERYYRAAAVLMQQKRIAQQSNIHPFYDEAEGTHLSTDGSVPNENQMVFDRLRYTANTNLDHPNNHKKNRFKKMLTKAHAQDVIDRVKHLEKVIEDMTDMRQKLMKDTAQEFDILAKEVQKILAGDDDYPQAGPTMLWAQTQSGAQEYVNGMQEYYRVIQDECDKYTDIRNRTNANVPLVNADDVPRLGVGARDFVAGEGDGHNGVGERDTNAEEEGQMRFRSTILRDEYYLNCLNPGADSRVIIPNMGGDEQIAGPGHFFTGPVAQGPGVNIDGGVSWPPPASDFRRRAEQDLNQYHITDRQAKAATEEGARARSKAKDEWTAKIKALRQKNLFDKRVSDKTFGLEEIIRKFSNPNYSLRWVRRSKVDLRLGGLYEGPDGFADETDFGTLGDSADTFMSPPGVTRSGPNQTVQQRVFDNRREAETFVIRTMGRLQNFLGQLHGRHADHIVLPLDGVENNAPREDDIAKIIIEERNTQNGAKPSKSTIETMSSGRDMFGVLNLALAGVATTSFPEDVSAIGQAMKAQERSNRSRIRRTMARYFLDNGNTVPYSAEIAENRARQAGLMPTDPEYNSAAEVAAQAEIDSRAPINAFVSFETEEQDNTRSALPYDAEGFFWQAATDYFVKLWQTRTSGLPEHALDDIDLPLPYGLDIPGEEVTEERIRDALRHGTTYAPFGELWSTSFRRVLDYADGAEEAAENEWWRRHPDIDFNDMARDSGHPASQCALFIVPKIPQIFPTVTYRATNTDEQHLEQDKRREHIGVRMDREKLITRPVRRPRRPRRVPANRAPTEQERIGGRWQAFEDEPLPQAPGRLSTVLPEDRRDGRNNVPMVPLTINPDPYIERFNQFIEDNTSSSVERFNYETHYKFVNKTFGSVFSAQYGSQGTPTWDAIQNGPDPDGYDTIIPIIRHTRSARSRPAWSNEPPSSQENPAVQWPYYSPAQIIPSQILPNNGLRGVLPLGLPDPWTTRRRMGTINGAGVYRGVSQYTYNGSATPITAHEDPTGPTHQPDHDPNPDHYRYGFLKAFLNSGTTMVTMVNTSNGQRDRDIKKGTDLNTEILAMFTKVRELQQEREAMSFSHLGSVLDGFDKFNSGKSKACTIKVQNLNKMFNVTTGVQVFGKTMQNQLPFDLLAEIRAEYQAIGLGVPTDDPSTSAPFPDPTVLTVAGTERGKHLFGVSKDVDATEKALSNIRRLAGEDPGSSSNKIKQQ